MSSTFTIAIAGISSRLARYVTQELLKHPNVHLRGSCRDIGKLPSDLTHSPRLLLMQAEPYDIDKLRSLVHGCDVVICCYCADDKTMLDGQKLLIDLYEEPMKHIKAYLDSKAKVNGVHILVGLLMEAFLAYFNVWDPKANKLYYWGTGSEKWDLTTYQTAAEFVAAVALDHNAVGLLKFLGDPRSAFEMVDDIESVYGVKPVLERLGSLQDLSLRVNSTGSSQDTIAELANRYSAAMYHTLTGKVTLGGDLDNARYPGIKPETFRDFLKKNQL
ncbi:hypothetical protein DL95DRAFT_317075 [Leptodontidium sp. 2 PMI_412]|nr:hypothetical protein DL95DRAFT_317075 [Leptodontidium sp. 2 PMI_412]